MICPKCETEYREGVSKCADCHIGLVDALPVEEILVCENCNNEIDESDIWCKRCGVLFDTTEEQCDDHKATAIGKCLICEKNLCAQEISKIKGKLFCKEHNHYIFTDNGWVRVYETGHDWEAELVKAELENNNIPAVVDSHKDHTRQFTVGHMSSIYVIVPFEDVLLAEDIIKRHINASHVHETEADDTKHLSADLAEHRRKLTTSIIKEAFLFSWHNRTVLFCALIVSILILSIIKLLTNNFNNVFEPFNLILLIPHFIFFTILGVTCHRLVLLGNNSVPSFGIRSWSKRESRFLGWFFVATIWRVIIFFPVVYLNAVGYEGTSIHSITQLTVSIIGWYFFSRFSILLPATATDNKYNLAWAWKTTMNNGINLMIILGIPAILYTPFYFMTGYNRVLDFFAYFMELICMTIGIVALSLSYNVLTNGKHNTY